VIPEDRRILSSTFPSPEIAETSPLSIVWPHLAADLAGNLN
jgi:hypothetical protein